MKKVLFISNRLIGGGSERVLTTIANKFSDKKYEVAIISYLGGDTYPLNKLITVYDLENEKNKFKRILKIRKIIKQYNPDTVIAFEFFVNMQAIIACIGLKVKLIVSERNDPAVRGGNFPNSIIRNILYRFCDMLVCQTIDAKLYFPKTIQKHATIIQNPLKEGLPDKWNGKRKKEIVNFCRLEKQKNIPLLIDAFEEFQKNNKDYVLTIYGNGKEKENIKNYIQERKLQEKVFLHEAVTEIHQKILQSAMFVSSSDYEGLSNSMIEAMAIGLPTICTDCPCGGAKMIIEDGVNGLLVPVRNKEELIKAMESIVENEKLSDKLSCNAVEIKQKLSVDKIVKEWEQIL